MRGREGAGTATACPHGHFQTRDNRWVAIACTTDKMFGRLAGAMGKPELASAGRYGQQSRRLAARAAVDALRGRWGGSTRVECGSWDRRRCSSHTLKGWEDMPRPARSGWRN